MSFKIINESDETWFFVKTPKGDILNWTRSDVEERAGMDFISRNIAVGEWLAPEQETGPDWFPNVWKKFQELGYSVVECYIEVVDYGDGCAMPRAVEVGAQREMSFIDPLTRRVTASGRVKYG